MHVDLKVHTALEDIMNNAPNGGDYEQCENFATYCRGGGVTFFFSIFFWRGDFFLALFLWTFFHKSDITSITTVVGAQEQHKGIFLKHCASIVATSTLELIHQINIMCAM